MPRPLTRRKFLGRALAGTTITSGAYSLWEARSCSVVRVRLVIPQLPLPFVNTTIAFLADLHHGPFVSLSHVRRVVQLTNLLHPDLIALGGDYVYKDRKYIAPAIAELAYLQANLGRFAVLGNHDHWKSGPETKAALARAGLTEITNSGVWLDYGGARLRLCGVGDLWTDRQDFDAALGDATSRDAVILLSHNPDFAEGIRDPRVGLVLSGHTHGGQVVLPGYGAPLVPSRYGQKYLHGLVQAPMTQVFITRGVGTVGIPLRFCCCPEVVLITLASSLGRIECIRVRATTHRKEVPNDR